MLDIYEFDSKTNQWKPFLTDDLQMEFTMMNPYYRLQMKLLSSSKPTYYISFRAPDKFGVFKFIIDYKRLGYSYLDVVTKVPLRPYNHNEYPRFLPTAYPYYIGVFSVFFAFVIFSLVFVFGKNKDD
jgi:oligosaccharyltransferase complex subunit beta